MRAGKNQRNKTHCCSVSVKVWTSMLVSSRGKKPYNNHLSIKKHNAIFCLKFMVPLNLTYIFYRIVFNDLLKRER